MKKQWREKKMSKAEFKKEWFRLSMELLDLERTRGKGCSAQWAALRLGMAYLRAFQEGVEEVGILT